MLYRSGDGGGSSWSQRHSATQADPAAVLVHLLVAKQQWQPTKVAQRLNLPLAVIDDCLAAGKSNTLLRTQLLQWITESGDVPHSIPAMLTAAAITQCTADDADDDERDDEDEALALSFGVVPRGHVEHLQRSIGHNFTSILNDPNEPDGSTAKSSSWSWLSDVFDYGTQQQPPGLGGSSVGGPRGGHPDARRLMAVEPVTRESFSLYLEYIGQAIAENKAEVEEFNRKMRCEDGRLLAEDELSWPHEVPEEYFASQFNMTRILEQLPLIHSSEEPQPASLVVDYEAFAAASEAVEIACQSLHGYARRVESSLMTHVQNKSERFFSATALFERMHKDATAALGALRLTQNETLAFGEQLVKDFLDVAILYRRQRHTEQVVEAVRRATRVVVQVAEIDASLQADMTSEAIVAASRTLASAIEAVFSSHGSHYFVEVAAFRSLQIRLMDQKRLATEIVLARTEKLLDVHNWSTTDWADVVMVLECAHQLGCSGSAIKRYQQNCEATLWECARGAIIEGLIAGSALTNDNAGQLLLAASAHAPLTEKKEFLKPVKKLRSQHFLSLVTNVADKILSAAAASAAHWERTISCSSMTSLGHLGSATTGESFANETTYFTQLLAAAQHPLLMLLELRDDENGNMRFHEMEVLSRTCFLFSRSLEQHLKVHVTPGTDDTDRSKPSAAFRAMVVNQARNFFRKQHEKQQQKMMMVLSEEQWVPEDRIDATFQHRCNVLCRFDVDAVKEFQASSVDSPTALNTAFSTSHEGSVGDAADQYDRKIFLPVGPNDEGYVVGNSLLMLLQTLFEYIHFLAAFPFLALEVINKIHDTLKLYDVQCAVLVLGASAVDQGKLATIAIPHLALASQCIAFLADLIPMLQNRLRATLPNPKLGPFITADLDRVHRNMTEHRNEFLAKMASMVREHIDSFQFDPVHWSTAGNAWIISMLKEPARLIKQLKPLLRSRDQRGVLGPVLHLIVAKVRDAIERVPPSMMTTQLEHTITADVKLLKLNADRFGYDAIRCVPHVAQSMEDVTINRPSTDDEFKAYFFRKHQARGHLPK